MGLLGSRSIYLPAGPIWPAVLVLTLALGGCRSLHLPEATVQDENDWLTEGGASDRSYVRDVALRPPLEKAWDYNAGGGFGPGSPLLVNGAVVVGTRKGEIHAIDIATGKSRGVLGVGESVDGTPVIDRFGILYVPVSWGRRGLYAYDLTRGSMLWRHKKVPVEAGLLLLDDRLIAADVESHVVAYDARTGDVLWDVALSDRAIVHAAPARIGPHHLAVADDQGVITALDASDGRPLWEVALTLPVYNTPAYSDEILYVPTTRGVLVGLDARTGNEILRFAVGSPTVKLTTPSVADSVLFVGGSNGVLYALDRTHGEILWSYESGEAIGGAPLVTRDLVYVADMGEWIRALDRVTGEVVWETELDGRIKSAMAAGAEGLVVLTEPRTVVFFRPEVRHAASR